MRPRTGLLAAGLLALASATTASAVVVPEGREIPVNRTANSQQENPSPAFGPGGVALVVWADSLRGVRGQLYGPGGARAGGALDLVPNELPAYPGEGPARFALEPAAVFTAGGGFLLAWAEERGHLRAAPFIQHFDRQGRRVFAQRFDSGGAPLGAAFAISSAADRLESWPRLHPLRGGQALVAWRSEPRGEAGGPGSGLFARELTRLGRPLGVERRISADGDGAAAYVTFAESRTGAVLLAWEGCCDAGGDLGVWTRAYDRATGTLGPIHALNVETSQPQRRPALAPAGPDGFLALWQGMIDLSTGHIYGRFLDASGTATGAPFQVSHAFGTLQLAPAVAAKPDGGFLAVWRDWFADRWFGLTALELNAAAAPVGEPFRLHERAVQKSGRTYLATDGAGNFLVPFERVVRGRASIAARRLASQ